MSVILVAEDHDVNREVLCRRLKRRGFAVIEARDGAEAVAAVQTNQPDLVLMDISMPVMDGIEAWRLITETVCAPPPAIALTATFIADVRLLCQEAGFSAFLGKPIEMSVLLTEMESLLAARSSTALAS